MRLRFIIVNNIILCHLQYVPRLLELVEELGGVWGKVRQEFEVFIKNKTDFEQKTCLKSVFCVIIIAEVIP